MNKKFLFAISLLVIASMLLAACAPKSVRVCGEGNVLSENGSDIRCKTDAPASTDEVPAQINTPPVIYDGVTNKVVDSGFRKYNKSADWIGDDFDIEHTLPATVVGPAIANLKSYRGSACGVVEIHEGETLVWPGGGAYWPAGSEGALVERWQHHVDEFLADYPDCPNVYKSAKDAPDPTK